MVDLGEVARALRVEAGFAKPRASSRVGAAKAALIRPTNTSPGSPSGRKSVAKPGPTQPSSNRETNPDESDRGFDSEPVAPKAVPRAEPDGLGDARLVGASVPPNRRRGALSDGPGRSRASEEVRPADTKPAASRVVIEAADPATKARTPVLDDTDVYDSVDIESELDSDLPELASGIDDEDEFDDVVIESAELGEELEGVSSVDLDEDDSQSDGDILSSDEIEAVKPAAANARPVPPPLPEFRFLLRPLTESTGDLVPIPETGVVLGAEGADVCVTSDPYVSPRHARFEIERGDLAVEDLGSANGTWLRVRGEAPLESGDTFLVGRQLLRYERVTRRSDDGVADDGAKRLGVSARQSDARLLQLAEDGEVHNICHFGRDGCRVGRSVADAVFTEDTFMSATHAVVVRRGDRYSLRDLASRNGTWIRLKGRRTLEPGDAVMVGQTAWRIGLPAK